MITLLRIHSKVCYTFAVILSVAVIALVIMLCTNCVPDFMTYPIEWVVEYFPKDDDVLLLFCFIGFVFVLMLIPGLLILGLIKLGQHLEKQERRNRYDKSITW